jgi:dynamin 1-like protein
MEPVYRILNQLQDTLYSANISNPIDLPQIAVVGSQSAGKSSVLESIVGKDFLPRGTGVVTRRPLILQLRKLDKDSDTDWAEFTHAPGDVYTDFSKVRDEIEAETNRLVGTKKQISPKPIILKCCVKNASDLTLIDLPGLTKVPIGDQPSDIGEKIRDLVLQFVSKPNCLILAVSAANVDLANSDSLSIAREVDPQGLRTIGVLTKIDLMDKGTDVIDILMGKAYPLTHGYVPVICRSQQDIKDQKSMAKCLADEKAFFRSRERYAKLASQTGIPYLRTYLSKLLLSHIFDVLPSIKHEIQAILEASEEELHSYGDTLDASNVTFATHGPLVLSIFTKYSQRFADAIDGKLNEIGVTPGQLSGGARINFIFHDMFTRHIMSLDPLEGLDDEDIRTAIRNATGPRTALFVPEIAFEIMVKQQIGKLDGPGLQCIEFVFDELQRLLISSEVHEMRRFSKLRLAMLEVGQNMLKRQIEPMTQMLHNIINVEKAYINISHPDFIGGSKAVSQAMTVRQMAYQDDPSVKPPSTGTRGQSRNPRSQVSTSPKSDENSLFSFFRFNPGGRSGSANTKNEAKPPKIARMPQVLNISVSNEREEMEVEIIKCLIVSYFDVVRKSFADLVPKSIMYFMVNTVSNELQSELVHQLYREATFKELTEENPEIALKRETCRETLRTMRLALETVNNVRDIARNIR